MVEPPRMPQEYFGTVMGTTGFTASAPRHWTPKEDAWVRRLLNEGYTKEQIAESTGRTAISVAVRIKRLQKKDLTYNASHLKDKYRCNHDFYNLLQPKSVLDLYAGQERFWANLMPAGTVDNDVRAGFGTTYSEKAERLICRLFYEGREFDLIDLDPFGSAYDCFHLAVQMAVKGLAVTFGELGHRRFRRLDYVRSHYLIDDERDFTLERMMAEVVRIGRMHKRELTPVIARTWRNIGRAYFTVNKLKITEQWEKNR